MGQSTEAVEFARAARARGLGFDAVAKALKDAGIRTITGRQTWGPGQVWAMLNSERYHALLARRGCTRRFQIWGARVVGRKPMLLCSFHYPEARDRAFSQMKESNYYKVLLKEKPVETEDPS